MGERKMVKWRKTKEGVSIVWEIQGQIETEEAKGGATDVAWDDDVDGFAYAMTTVLSPKHQFPSFLPPSLICFILHSQVIDIEII